MKIRRRIHAPTAARLHAAVSLAKAQTILGKAIIFMAFAVLLAPSIATSQVTNPTTNIISGCEHLDGAYGIAVDAGGNVHVAGYGTDNAFKITPGGTITQIIDSTGCGTALKGP